MCPSALGCADSPEPKFSPLNSPLLPRGMPVQEPGIGTPPLHTHISVCIYAHPTSSEISRRLGRIVKAAASKVVKKAALAQPREPLGRPRTGSEGEGTPHFATRDGRGPRELAVKTQGQAYPPGECGLLRLNSRVGGGQTTQPWVSPDTVPPSRLVSASPELRHAHTGA